MSRTELKKLIREHIGDKIIFSNISGRQAEVVEKLPEEIVPGKVLFDGLDLFDGVKGFEYDIQQMHSFIQNCEIVNLEDYYTDKALLKKIDC